MVLRTVILILAFCFLVGCNSSPDADFLKEANDTNIKKMANAYMLFASWSRYTGPASLTEFKEFLRTDARITKNLERMGIEREKLDDYFISENDGKEFDFRWGVFIDPDRRRSSEPLVFEKEGKNGIRLVILSSSEVLEVASDKKYQSLLKGRVDREDANTEVEEEEAALSAEFEAE